MTLSTKRRAREANSDEPWEREASNVRVAANHDIECVDIEWLALLRIPAEPRDEEQLSESGALASKGGPRFVIAHAVIDALIVQLLQGP